MIMSIILVIIAVSLSSPVIESAPVEDDPYYGCRGMTKDLNRVCGSDGKVYDNISALKCAAVKNNDLKVVDYGKCAEIAVSLSSSSIESAPEEDNPFEGCGPITKDQNQVCGSDGNLYDNISQLNCAALKNKDLKEVECSEPAKIDSATTPEEVTAPKLAVSLSSSSIESASVEDNLFEGCGPITKDQNQVCGSDGNLYDNISQLRCAALKNKDLKEVECSEPAKIDSATTPKEKSDEKP